MAIPTHRIDELRKAFSNPTAGAYVRVSQEEYDYIINNWLEVNPSRLVVRGTAADHHAEDVKKAVEHLANLPKSALDTQVGGNHYKSKGIQPIEYIHANGLNFSEGSIVKYITRWRDKGGVKDLEKIKHYVDLMIEMEKKYPKTET